MLTRELLRFHTRSGSVKPDFLSTDDRMLLQKAEELLHLYHSSTGVSREELDTMTSSLSASGRDRKLIPGLRKVLEDASVFSGDDSVDYAAERRKLFTESSELLRKGELPVRAQEFREKLFSGEKYASLRDNLYPDLPEYHRLIETVHWTGDELLNRYNCVLAQSLILYASDLRAEITDPDPAHVRRLFRYIKFFRLLAEAEKCRWINGAPGFLSLRISGPASILDMPMRYGLSLASFLPAVFQMTEWKITAELKLKPGETLKLTLDRKSGLSRKFGSFSAYIPEEIRMFADLFAQNGTGWTIARESPFLRLENTQEFLFPDMTFTDGKQFVHLELFHRWHAAKLRERMEFLLRYPEFPLLIGADRTLPREEKEAVKASPLYGKKLFLFRDFPGVENVLKLLNALTAGR